MCPLLSGSGTTSDVIHPPSLLNQAYRIIWVIFNLLGSLIGDPQSLLESLNSEFSQASDFEWPILKSPDHQIQRSWLHLRVFHFLLISGLDTLSKFVQFRVYSFWNTLNIATLMHYRVHPLIFHLDLSFHCGLATWLDTWHSYRITNPPHKGTQML
jgi:hypothetical protein